MSVKHPVIAVTGSSGAGTTTVKNAFEHIFRREKINPLVVEGDSYHRYDRAAMKVAINEFAAKGKQLSHFGPEANHFDLIADTFKSYSETGKCRRRYRVLARFYMSPQVAELYPDDFCGTPAVLCNGEP